MIALACVVATGVGATAFVTYQLGYAAGQRRAGKDIAEAYEFGKHVGEIRGAR